MGNGVMAIGPQLPRPSSTLPPRGYPHLRRHERLKGHLGEFGEPKNLLILLGRKRGWVSDAAMPTVGSNLAAETADGDGVETSRNCSKDAHLGLKSTRDASSALELSQFEHRRTSRSTGGRMSALERPDPTGMASLPARSDRAGLTASSLPQSPILSTLGAADGGQSLDAGADRVNAGAPHA